MLERLSQSFVRFSQRYMPDPFLFAVLLTFLTFLLGIGIAHNTPLQMVLHWYGGFWSFLAFGMEMVLILVTGHALASSGPVNALLKRLAQSPKNGRQAVFLGAIVAILAGWINWGLGLILGALFARELAKVAGEKKIKVHYPLLGAAGYISQLAWHGGLSASAPLLVNTPGNPFEKLIGGLVPTSQTIFTPYNLIAVVVLFIVAPWVLSAMHPKDEAVVTAPVDGAANVVAAAAEPVARERTFADAIENSTLIAWLLGLMGLTYLVYYFMTKGFNLQLDIVNFTFLFAGLILHRTPIAYARAISDAIKGASGIVLQFPFYAGIMGMLGGSGLVAIIAHWFVSFSTASTLPFWTYLASIVTKLFVPSGGGEFGVEGPIMIKAAQTLHADIGRTIMAISYGNMLGNMFQPFWAIALLGIMGLRARDIMGYCMVMFLVALPVLGIAITWLP